MGVEVNPGCGATGGAIAARSGLDMLHDSAKTSAEFVSWIKAAASSSGGIIYIETLMT